MVRFRLARGSALAALVGTLTACGGEPAATGAGSGEQRDLTLTEATDLDPNPGVVRVAFAAEPTSIELVPGQPTRAVTYGGRLPGPLIRARKNDRIVVELENRLDQPTTIHWHGVRVPNGMDGVPGETQPLVQPGTTFVYEWDALDAALFWYHPHYDTLEQLGRGLYGALLVEDPDEPKLGDDVVLVLSDAAIGPNGEAVPEPDPFDAAFVGREGSLVLVNGKVYPKLDVNEGRRVRLRIVNAARSRYFRLGLSGHMFLRIGGDGGLLTQAVPIETPLLAPGERADLLLEPRGRPGESLDLEALPYARGLTLPESARLPLVELAFGEPAGPFPPLPNLERSMAPIEPAGAPVIPMVFRMEAEPELRMSIDVPTSDGMIHARVGDTHVYELVNESIYDHPFHLHGFFFQRLDASGALASPLELKDTLNLPAASIERVVVRYDDRPGMWMFHCHIIDHAEVGMMGMLHVSR